jgi:hypothetical protein
MSLTIRTQIYNQHGDRNAQGGPTLHPSDWWDSARFRVFSTPEQNLALEVLSPPTPTLAANASRSGRAVKIYLVNGIPSGVITAEIMNWTGKFTVAPHTQ